MRNLFFIQYLFIFVSTFNGCSENSTSTNPDDNQVDYVLGEFQNNIINLPQGSPVSIDGRMNEAIWESAHIAQLAENEEVHLMYSNGFLYVGFRTKERPVTTVFLYRDSKVYLLHSSAGVGSAIYEYNGSNWALTKPFSWHCRDGSASASAVNARQQFLADEGWLANIAFTGSSTEKEFQIAMSEETLLIAAAALGEPDYNDLSIWPLNTSDKCQDPVMLQGPIPETAQFIPEKWIPVNR